MKDVRIVTCSPSTNRAHTQPGRLALVFAIGCSAHDEGTHVRFADIGYGRSAVTYTRQVPALTRRVFARLLAGRDDLR